MNDAIYVVGIGASAGGLDAYARLLTRLPSDTGMAFILIQHLAPNHPSSLAEILRHSTTMPVDQVVDQMTVEPNHIYVIPPNTKMSFSDGILSLSLREDVRGRPMPIDYFFISLAESQGSNAIGVILSGSDEDGTLGLQAIRQNGGITLAQDVQSAQFSNMPNSPALKGFVDFVLPPEQIAEQLVKISCHPYVRVLQPSKPLAVVGNEEDFAPIFALIKTKTSIDFTYYKQKTISRRIMRRMLVNNVPDLESYNRYVTDHPTEVDALCQDLLINVTSFFRDPETFELLKAEIIPGLLHERPANLPIRAWVAGCSTGEEAYSLAICLHEVLALHQVTLPIQIFATDVSDQVIDKARKGIYQSLESQLSPERLKRYFTAVDDGYQVNKIIRDMCVFARQNLISDPPFSNLDLISCRNVLIYLRPALQKRVFQIFHYALKDAGILLLGPSESTGDSELFLNIDRKCKIYTRQTSMSRLNLGFILDKQPRTQERNLAASQSRAIDSEDLQTEVDQMILTEFSPAALVVNSKLEILHFRGPINPYLRISSGRASLNLFKMLHPDLVLEVRKAIHQVKKSAELVNRKLLQIQLKDKIQYLDLVVKPLKSAPLEELSFLIIFQEVSPPVEVLPPSPQRTARRKISLQDQEITQLKQELVVTKQHLQSIIEDKENYNQDLKVANEEILSSNEELQSTNEELETAKEEIQATNEELITINEELRTSISQANIVSNVLENLIRSVDIPILMLDSNLCIRRFTTPAQKYFNVIQSDVGRRFTDIKANLDIPNFEGLVQQVIETNLIQEQEIQDQDQHWHKLLIHPYRTVDNRIDGAVILLIDIQLLKQNSAALTVSLDYTNAIVEAIQIPLLFLNQDLRIESANHAFYEKFQLSPAATKSQFIYQLDGGRWNIPELENLLEIILPQTNRVEKYEVEHDFPKIGLRTLRINAYAMNQTDQAKSIFLAFEDITEAKHFEEERSQLLAQENAARLEAEASNRAKDHFLAMLSHELRNPLNTIVGWSQLLRRGNLDATQIKRALEVLENSARLQNQLIDDLLDTSRIRVGVLNINKTPLSLSTILQSSIEVVRPTAEAKRVTLTAQLGPLIGQMVGDQDRLGQVFWNLLTNAVKFTPAGGRVEITLEQVARQAKLEIRDNGVGIDPEFLPYVFDRFRQADSQITREYGGLGLGLTIVRHLIELHGGTVSAESAGQGLGTTITVYLPLHPPTTADPSDRAVTNLTMLIGARILVVDDDSSILELFDLILTEAGAEVTTCTNTADALATLMAGSFDVLLSDIAMPGEDGCALIQKVRALPQKGQIPAAALTGYADIQRSLDAGYQAHLTKPVTPLQLVALIQVLLGRVNP